MSLKYTICNSPKANKLNGNNKINKQISKKFQRNIQEPYHIWRWLRHPSSLYVKRFLESAMACIKTETTTELVINLVNISNSIKIILTKFAVTVVRLPLLFLKSSTLEKFLMSLGIMLQTFDAKYLNAFKPNFVALTVFLKKSVCDLFNTLVGKI